jgi:hypothetical protein
MKSWLRGDVTGIFGALSVFGRLIKGMIGYGLSSSDLATSHVTTIRSSALLFIPDSSVLKSVVQFLEHFVIVKWSGLGKVS